jgi:hypothetical protein
MLRSVQNGQFLYSPLNHPSNFAIAGERVGHIGDLRPQVVVPPPRLDDAPVLNKAFEPARHYIAREVHVGGDLGDGFV